MSGAKLGVGVVILALVVGGAIALSGGGHPPELKLEPVVGETRQVGVDLQGQARGPEGMNLDMDGLQLRLGPPDDDGWRTFQTRATLVEAGAHTVTLSLTQDGETLASQSVTIKRIVETLGIEVSEPAEGAILGEPTVTVRGKLVGPVDLDRSRLLLNDGRVDVNSDGSFELEHRVRPGKQTLTLRLQGQQSAELVRTVHYDASAPWVEIYRPTDKFTLRPKLKVVFRAWDEAKTLKLELGDLEAEVQTGELWSGEVPVEEGDSELTLRLTDPAGNRYEKVLEIQRVAPQPIESKGFLDVFANESSSSGKTRMIRSLDPDDEVARLTLIARCLTRLDWNHSQSAVLALSTWSDQETLRSLPGKNAPKVAQNPQVLGPLVERLLLALGFAADPANVPTLIGFVENENWNLRRGAAAALERLPDERALVPLATAFVKEKHPLVRAAFQRALERISRHYEPNPQAWLTWAKSDDARLGDPRNPTNMPEFTAKRMVSGELAWHVTARGELQGKRPLLVLPDMGLDVSSIEPYLRALEDTRRVIYLQIPFPREPKLGKNFNSYPFQKVADSLSNLVKQLQNRGVIPAEGVSLLGAGHGGWLAATYARTDPVMVNRQILVSTPPTAEAWFFAVRQLRERWKADRDMDLMLVGNLLANPGNTPPLAFNQGGLNAVCKFFSIQFANPSEPEIAHVVGPLVRKEFEGESFDVYRGWRPLVGYKWSSFDLTTVAKHTETLLVQGSSDPFFNDFAREVIQRELAPAEGIPGVAQVRQTLPWAVEVIPGCRRFPWVEEPEYFVALVNSYLDP